MKKIAVLVSGGGTNLQALIDAEARGELGEGKITLVIASKPGVYALERAANHGIPALVLSRKDYASIADYSRVLADTMTEAGIVSMITVIAFIWLGLLLFCGTMITHDYSIFKNLITILGTVVAMAFIVFIVLLFSMLLSKLVGLVTNVITEIQYRI